MTIDISQLSHATNLEDPCERAGASDNCNMTYSDDGMVQARGYRCLDPEGSGHVGYAWSSNTDQSFYSEDLSLSGLRCANGYEGEAIATACHTHNGPITFSGCRQKCVEPPGTYTEKGINGPPNLLPALMRSGTIDLNPNLHCDSESMYPASSACFGESGIIPGHDSGTCATAGNVWFEGGGPLRARCINSDMATGAIPDYQIIGCEEGCRSRIDSDGSGSQPYITYGSETPSEIISNDRLYGSNRETIFIGDEQLSGVDSDPYNVTEGTGSRNPGSFSVTATCDSVTTADNVQVQFDTPFSNVSTHRCSPQDTDYISSLGPPTCSGSVDDQGNACALNTDNTACQVPTGDCVFSGDGINTHLKDRRYAVSGCYPSCDVTERCINMKFQYDEGQGPDHDAFKLNMKERYQNILSVSDADKTAEEIGVLGDEFSDSIYYYRKYRHRAPGSGTASDYIEAQLKCTNDECEFINSEMEGDAFGGVVVSRSNWIIGDLHQTCTEACSPQGDGPGGYIPEIGATGDFISNTCVDGDIGISSIGDFYEKLSGAYFNNTLGLTANVGFADAGQEECSAPWFRADNGPEITPLVPESCRPRQTEGELKVSSGGNGGDEIYVENGVGYTWRGTIEQHEYHCGSTLYGERVPGQIRPAFTGQLPTEIRYVTGSVLPTTMEGDMILPELDSTDAPPRRIVGSSEAERRSSCEDDHNTDPNTLTGAGGCVYTAPSSFGADASSPTSTFSCSQSIFRNPQVCDAEPSKESSRRLCKCTETRTGPD